MGKKGSKKDKNDPWAASSGYTVDDDVERAARALAGGRKARGRTTSEDVPDGEIAQVPVSEEEADRQLALAIEASLADGDEGMDSGRKFSGLVEEDADTVAKRAGQKNKNKRSPKLGPGSPIIGPGSPKVGPAADSSLPDTASGTQDTWVNLFGLQCHHGKYVRFETDGSVKGTSSKIGDPEKFELVKNEDGSVSLKTHFGKYLSADKSGTVGAHRAEIGDAERFQLLIHTGGMQTGGTVSFQSFAGTFIAATKGTLIANRGMAGAWEKFELKPRGQKKLSRDSQDSAAALAAAAIGASVLFDACCDLQAVLFAEEKYALSHSDTVAISWEKRARSRRASGLEWSFRHFCKHNSYPPNFRGCVSFWDATVILPSSEFVTEKSAFAGAEWRTILDDGDPHGLPGGSSISAAFGIPASSAAEVDSSTFDRLSELCQLPRCVAIGPVGLDMSPLASDPEPSEHYRGLSFAGISATFGGPLRAASYDPLQDPKYLAWLECNPGSKRETWILTYGDRREAAFQAARADYARRRSDAQSSVAERQIRLAKDLGLPLILHIPPQDDAERGMAQLLLDVFGEGSDHPMLLSSFRGRPKCAAMLLKAFPTLFVGFSGLLTHKKQQTLGEVAFDTPLERMVLESLGPMFPPSVAGDSGSRGSYSHPRHVADVATELARIKNVRPDEVLEAAWRNVHKLYRLAPDCVPEESVLAAVGSRDEVTAVPPEYDSA